MTASLTSERPGKRDRLIAGARETIHRQGVEATTLADIAEASGVPLGNVYYYFKSKDELVAAVIDSYARESRERLSWLEQQHRTPRARLKTLVRLLVSHPDQVVLYGCPRGSLCSELDKQDNDLARACQELMHMPVAWIEQQFKAMGRRDARDLAFALLASYEGIALLTNTFRDPELMVREGRRLDRWIDSVARHSKAAPAGPDGGDRRPDETGTGAQPDHSPANRTLARPGGQVGRAGHRSAADRTAAAGPRRTRRGPAGWFITRTRREGGDDLTLTSDPPDTVATASRKRRGSGGS